MSLDWPQILGTLIAGLGAIGSLIFGGKWFLTQRRAILPKPPTASRSADAGAPPGAVEWVLDIIAAMSASPESCVLSALVDSCSRDQARARRIEQLESRKPMATISATSTEHTAVLRPQEPAT